MAKTNSAPNAVSTWSTTEALTTDAQPQQRKVRPPLTERKADSRPAAQLLVSASPAVPEHSVPQWS